MDFFTVSNAIVVVVCVATSGCARIGRAQKKKGLGGGGVGRRGEEKATLRDKPLDFENSVRPRGL